MNLHNCKTLQLHTHCICQVVVQSNVQQWAGCMCVAFAEPSWSACMTQSAGSYCAKAGRQTSLRQQDRLFRHRHLSKACIPFRKADLHSALKTARSTRSCFCKWLCMEACIGQAGRCCRYCCCNSSNSCHACLLVLVQHACSCKLYNSYLYLASVCRRDLAQDAHRTVCHSCCCAFTASLHLGKQDNLQP